MRFRRMAIVALACVSLAAQDGRFKDGLFVRDAKANDLLASARIAIFGGPGGIARLQTLRLKGRSRFPSDDGALIDASVEIRVMLPDRYDRIDTGAFGRRVIGYAGSVSLDSIETSDGSKKADARDKATILRSDRADLARLMLGVATFASEEVPMQFQTRGTQREMPGPSDPLAVDAAGDEGFAARIVFDGKSHLPARLIFWGPNRTVQTTTYSDWRPSGSMKVPYRIVTTSGDRLADELLFDDVAVNPSLKKADFSR